MKTARSFLPLTDSAMTMRAMSLQAPGQPLRVLELPVPRPGRRQVLLKVKACAVCRTDLHILDGELNRPKLPLIPGHEIVGVVETIGEEVGTLRVGDRVGVPWLGSTCGACRFCRSGRENLCPEARFTGYDIDGGYAEYVVANADFCFLLPPEYADVEVAPLLCAGLIGFRSLRMAGEGQRLGIYGFGAAGHLVAQVAVRQGRRVFAFTRPGDEPAQRLARQLGVEWAGDSTEQVREELDAAIIFAPVGELIPLALRAVAPGGVVVCGGIHMSDIPGFPYELLWGERTVRSVANLTRRDGDEFLALAPQLGVEAVVQPYPLEEANEALHALRSGSLTGAAVLLPDLEPGARD